MFSLLMLALQITLSLAISAATIVLLKPLLREVLSDLCGTRTRADFWSAFTQLLIILSPLLIVTYFAPIDSNSTLNAVEIFRQALFRALLGDFIAVSTIGFVIFKSIGTAYDQTATKT